MENNQYKRYCISCNKEIFYSSKKSLLAAIKNNSLCSSCCIKGNKNPLFGKRRWNQDLHWSDEIKNKISLGNKGKIISEETKLKISLANKGRKLSNEHKKKIVRIGKPSGMKGKHHSNITKSIIGDHSKGNKYRLHKNHSVETKRKIRESHVKRILSIGICPRYNPKASQFINELNNKNKWNLQHALNGGEIHLCGYFIDGYDKEKNIIFEYDEPSHYNHNNNLKEKDLKRQEEIINYIKPSKFLRYNEKINTLYDVINGTSTALQVTLKEPITNIDEK